MGLPTMGMGAQPRVLTETGVRPPGSMGSSHDNPPDYMRPPTGPHYNHEMPTATGVPTALGPRMPTRTRTREPRGMPPPEIIQQMMQHAMSQMGGIMGEGPDGGISWGVYNYNLL